MSAAGSEPAYPLASEIIGHQGGMSMRQYYAAQALAGMMANPVNRRCRLRGTSAVWRFKSPTR